MNSAMRAPFRPIDFAKPEVAVERRPDGTIVLRHPRPLDAGVRHILDYLRDWAEREPARPFLHQRDLKDRWRTLGYGEAWRGARAVAQALIDRGLAASGRAVSILSSNSLEHALMTFGAMAAGVPLAPVSPAYSVMSRDHAKLKYVIGLIDPALVFVQDARLYRKALAAIDMGGRELVAAEDLTPGATDFASLLATAPGPAVDQAYAKVGPDSVAKYLFTSGSTGMPKAVINTMRMLTANQQMAAQLAPPKPEDRALVLDWLPWHHTFGGNFNIHAIMRLGGEMYIDAGRPIPGLFDVTVKNLRELSPTGFSNVPVGYAMLAPVLEGDAELRARFFRDLKLLSYGGASLPRELWQRYQDMAVATIGQRIMFVTGWGSTETAPTATTLHWAIEGTGNIGLPYPGVEIKMVPVGDKHELRVRGPIVTPGYYKQPDLTQKAFDEEGFYRIGDAGRLIDPADPIKGLAFAGRVAEDFKLQSGTWVSTGGTRLATLEAAAPALQDAVVTGHDRPYVGLMAWPNVAACQKLLTDPANGASMAKLARDPGVIAHVKRGLAALNARAGGSSNVIRRFLLLDTPASLDAGELTDKGYINQAAALAARKERVEALYADPPGEGVIAVD
ncbi:MAG: AMP-binding protein [Alphaproteobacteria bacterium]|nr:AMP-binding protein [Alphaproteobacteria bacterium]